MTDPILEKLRSDGEIVEVDQFSVDAEAAREKLAKYRLSDPHEYILHVVEAAHLLGAELIELEIATSNVVVEFDGGRLRRHHVEDIYQAAFRRIVDDRTRAARHLSIAISSAQRVDPQRIVVQCAPDASGEAAVLEIDSEGEQSTAIRKRDASKTLFRLEETLRLSHFREYLFEDTPVEREITAERVRFSDVPTFIGNEEVGRGFELPHSASHVIREESEETRLRVGVVHPSDATTPVGASQRRSEGGPLEPATVAILQNGVEVERHHLGYEYGGVRPMALVESSRLNRNLSQTAFVRDDAWAEIVEARLPALVEQSLTELLETAGSRTWKTYFPWFQAVGVDVYRAVGDGALDDSHPLVEALADRPLFPAATNYDPEAVEEDAEVGSVDSSGFVEYEGTPFVSFNRLTDGGDVAPLWSRRRFERLDPIFERPVLNTRFVGGSIRVEVPRAVYEGGQNVTWELESADFRQRRRLGWTGTLPYASPPSTSHPFREHEWWERIECSLYMRRPEDSGVATFDTVVEGQLVTSWEAEGLPVPPFTCVLMGDLQTNEAFDNVVRDAAYRGAAVRGFELLLDVFVDAAEELFAIDWDASSTDFAEAAVRSSDDPGEKSDAGVRAVEIAEVPLDWVTEGLEGVVSGRLASAFFRAAKLDSESARELLDEELAAESDGGARELARAAADSFGSSQPLDVQVEQLGPLADLPAFEVITERRGAVREAISVRQAAALSRSRGELPLIRREAVPPHPDRSKALAPSYAEAPDRWRRAWRAAHRASHLEVPVVVEPEGLSLSRELFGDAVAQVEHELSDRTRREEFFARADSVPAVGEGYEQTGEVSGERWTADIGLDSLGASDPASIELYFDHRSYQLEHRRVETPVGRFDAVVRGRAVRPADDWSGLARSLDVSSWIDRVKRGAERLVVEHCRALHSTPQNGPEARLAVWRAIGATAGTDWEETLEQVSAFPTVRDRILSLRELRRAAREFGEIGSVPRGRPVLEPLPIDSDAPIVVVPDRSDALEVLQSLVSEDSLVDVESTEAAEAAVERAREAFLDKPRVGLSVEAIPRLAELGRPVWEQQVDSERIRGQVALLASDSDVDGGKAVCAVLHRDRLLSIETFSVPYGRFCAVCSSPTFHPDDDYRSLGRGRSRLRRWIAVETGMLIDRGCERLADVASEPPAELRRELLQLAVASEIEPSRTVAWAVAADRLAESPLFLTSTGRAMSVSDLLERVDRGGVSFAVSVFDEKTHDSALGVSHDRTLLVSARPFGWSAADLSTRLAALAPDAVVRSADRIRSTVAAETGLDLSGERTADASDDADLVIRELAILCEDQEIFGSHRDLQDLEFVDREDPPVEIGSDRVARIARGDPVVAHLLGEARSSETAHVLCEAFLAAWIYGRVARRLRGIDTDHVADFDARQAVRVWRRLHDPDED